MFKKNLRIMPLVFYVFVVLSFGLVGANEKRSMAISIDETIDDENKTVLKLKLNGEEVKVNDLQLEEGEVHNITTESGRHVEISHVGDSYQVTVDGENINMYLSELHDTLNNLDVDVLMDDIDKKIKKLIIKGDFDENTISVLGSLTTEEKDALVNALKAVNDEKKLEFIDVDAETAHDATQQEIKILKLHK